MRSPRSRSPRARLVAAALAGGLVLAACGGDGGGDSSDAGADSAVDEAPTPPDEAEVTPESDTATNQLPDVVVDDLIAGNQVNVRNLAPSDRPILLWMWAPF